MLLWNDTDSKVLLIFCKEFCSGCGRSVVCSSGTRLSSWSGPNGRASGPNGNAWNGCGSRSRKTWSSPSPSARPRCPTHDRARTGVHTYRTGVHTAGRYPPHRLDTHRSCSCAERSCTHVTWGRAQGWPAWEQTFLSAAAVGPGPAPQVLLHCAVGTALASEPQYYFDSCLNSCWSSVTMDPYFSRAADWRSPWTQHTAFKSVYLKRRLMVTHTHLHTQTHAHRQM